MMTVQRRMMTIKLIEKMERNPEYCKQIGLENTSTFKGERVSTPKHNSSNNSK